MYDAFDRGESAVGVFLDLAKAFDTLDRNILIEKLNYYGVGGVELEWFRSYFSERKQLVKYGGVNSDLMSINYGVPQGSVLGTILFCIFMNDIVKSSNYLNFVLYADDTCVFRSDSDISNNISIVNRELLNVKKWMQANCLTLNFKKCHYLLFRRKQRVLPDNINNIYLGGAKLNKQENTKYLGVVLDEHLSWAFHVNHLCRKLSKFIPLLYNVRENMLKENLRFVYNSLIYPVLIYCNVVWGGCCKTYLAPLQVIQRKILRIMSFKNRYDHTAPLFLDFNALTVDRINIYVSIILVFKCLQNRSNDVFQRYIGWLVLTLWLSLTPGLSIRGSLCAGEGVIFGISCLVILQEFTTVMLSKFT